MAEAIADFLYMPKDLGKEFKGKVLTIPALLWVVISSQHGIALFVVVVLS